MAQIKTKYIENSAVTTAKIANANVTGAKIESSVALAGSPTTTTQSVGDNSTKIATTAFVQAAFSASSAGLDVKQSVRALKDSNLALTGGASLSVDGVTTANGDRLLLTGQTAGAENGIYTVSGIGTAYALTRSTDADASSEVTGGMFTFVTEGTSYADTGWVLTTNDPITLDTTSLTFTQFTGTGSITAGAGLTKTGNTLDVGAGDGITVNANDVAVNVSAIAGTGLEDDGSNNLRIAASAAGNGLSGGAGSALSVNVDDSTIEINSDTLRVKDAGITSAKLAAAVAGAGLTGGAGSALAVGAGDGITVNADDVAVNVTAIAGAGLENDGSNNLRIAASAAGNGLALSTGVLSVNTDGVTTKITSDNVEALKNNEEKFTLSGTDITNQYIDLAHAAYGTSASVNSIMLAAGGVTQTKVTDYTVSLTGGSGGVTRITFAGDLATGGAIELASGDILVVYYSYL